MIPKDHKCLFCVCGRGMWELVSFVRGLKVIV